MATDWIIHLEGRGDTHNSGLGDADTLMLELLKKLLATGHFVTQARFTADRPEENFLEDTTLDLHEQLVAKALRARDDGKPFVTTSPPEAVWPGCNPPKIDPQHPPSGSGISNAP